MRRCALAAMPLMLLVLAVPAGAQAASYKARIAPLTASSGGPADGQTTAARRKRGRGHRGTGAVRGKARLSDGARRDGLRISVRGLARGERYTWSLRAAAAGGDACAGEVVDAFAYRPLRRGRAKARARARDFALQAGTAYAVVVTAAGGEDVACGAFRGTPAAGDDPIEDESLDDEPVADGDESVDDEDMPLEDEVLEDEGDPGDDSGEDF